MGTIVVEAKRLPPEPKVVKMETITVVAQRERPDGTGANVATAGGETGEESHGVIASFISRPASVI